MTTTHHFYGKTKDAQAHINLEQDDAKHVSFIVGDK